MQFITRTAVAATMALSAFASAQFGENVTQYSRISLSTFDASSGNDCWGYVSDSGREYAIMGLSNKVAFVEVTNPAAPQIIKTIPHTSSTWADIKVRGDFAYAVTEAGGTGIQVIDMSQIDSGIVTLVRTIASPGRSHNLVMDEQNGFLYTVGSNQSSGTTTCFDLSNPGNPIQVGAASMTTNYIHDAQVVTWETGNLAGRQLFFGCSEGRGVDIYDMTNKNAPTLVKRVTYPNMSYCHQAWLSADRKYLFVDDELDENALFVSTRSLVFNVEDPENAFFVGTFSTGLPSIDHNQYVVDGFSFQANYRSGLRIFDVADAPTTITPVGFYDTYPSNDDRGFDGAWSCYPFFPSGNVIISDINRGLFVVNVSQAVTRKHTPATALLKGRTLDGHGPELVATADGQGWQLTSGPSSTTTAVEVEFSAQAFDEQPQSITFAMRSSESSGAYFKRIEIYNFQLGTWQSLSVGPVSKTPKDITLTANGNPASFVQPGTHVVKVRLAYDQASRNGQRLVADIDFAEFRIER